MEEQADRTGIHPLKIVDDQQQRLATGQILQDVRILGEEIALVHVCGRAFTLVTADEGLQLVKQRPVLGGNRCRGAIQQRCAGKEGVNQIGADLQQRLDGLGSQAPQPFGVGPAHGPGAPARFDVAGQQLQDLAKGEVGVADAGVGIAVAGRNHQVGMFLLASTDKRLGQQGLAVTGLARDESDDCRCRPALPPGGRQVGRARVGGPLTAWTLGRHRRSVAAERRVSRSDRAQGAVWPQIRRVPWPQSAPDLDRE